MTSGATERKFESEIEASLLSRGGWARGDAKTFDTALGLDRSEVLAFLRATQERAWASLVARYGSEAAAEAGFLTRLTSQIDEHGTVDVLRHGVKDHGVEVRLAYFRPAHGLTPELVQRYDANRLTVIRQFAYDTSGKTIDLALLVNGIPVATAELKNPVTGQTVEDAVAQYRRDRDPANVTLARRAVVHFAVDPDLIQMSTRLAGEATLFLPFNRGSEDGGAGNPPNPTGHRTAYLWEEVWQRDAWLDLLARFVQLERPTTGSVAERRAKTRVIFPRFHQWDAVRRLEAHARTHGAGHNYLVQHSAGSGKSNSIAWLAHRLSSLHGDDDRPVFDKVVVITDRLVLDRQLQDTVYQFDHVHGLVELIAKSSTELADALAGERARIIVTTLQKFPYVLDKVGELPARRYAVIVDEAHSSQTGEAAAELKRVLSGAPGTAAGAAVAASENDEELDADELHDLLVRSLEGRGKRPNLSFFAFTATPKAKTLELFGTPVDTPDGPRPRPFHLYSMRQAIEEGFILDVLSYYTTYQTFWRVEKTVTDDPTYNPERARAAIARFASLHPTNLAQRAEIIVEHFRAHTAHKIGGKAKAMVVTSSRLHAVRMKLAIDAYLAAKGYRDVAALVAFSGTVNDDGIDATEPGMNGFPESQTAERFASDAYQLLVVAEKFQTGFDQPLLHTMYVDKVLTGLNAVQTLCRLNRTHPQKSDTFVLDFRNEVELIQDEFRPYYGATEAIPTDPNLVYDAHRALWDFGVLREDEVEAGVRALLAVAAPGGHGAAYAALDPARERFTELDEEVQDAFRDVLARFVSLYAFISQIVPYVDRTLERDYVYGRALQAALPGQAAERLDLGREVELTHLKLERTFEGSASLDEGGGEVIAMFSGRGKEHDPEKEHLSTIVEVINERHGTGLGEGDQILFDQFEESWAADTTLGARARANTFENFLLVFKQTFMDTVATRMDQNEAIFKRILDDPVFQETVFDYYAERLYARLRADHDQLGLTEASE